MRGCKPSSLNNLDVGLQQSGTQRLVIVGGGASGLACALTATRLGVSTVLLERMDRCGSKLAITGGSRANLTHADTPRGMARKFSCEPGLLIPLLRMVPYQRVVEFFASVGVRCRTDDAGCIWPEGMGASRLRDQLVHAARAGGVDIRTGCRVRAVSRDTGMWHTDLGGRDMVAGAVCIATGGASRPGTGSSGDGLGLCSSLGLATTGWFPALCSLEPRQPVEELAGITQQPVSMVLSVAGDAVRKATGHFIFAHRYVSGSAILNLAGHAARALQQKQDVRLTVDWIPALGPAALDGEIRTGRARQGHRLVVNWLNRFVARRLADRLVRDAGVPPDRRMTELARTELQALVRVLKQTVFDIKGTEPIERATVTGGGVVLDEVELTTCEARRLPRLYITGELLGTWAETGGYNLHLAWATGIAAGEAAARNLVSDKSL